MSPKKSTTQTTPIASLVEDMNLYPRHAVDSAHVAQLANAIEAGSQFPPLVADKKSKRITDGWHRARAYVKVHGPNATTDVELVEYRSEAEMILDAVQRNSKHGRRLDAVDLTRAVLMLENRHVDRHRIALVLNVTEERVEKLRIRVAVSRSADESTVPGTRKIVLKRPVRHMKDATLTKDQVEAHKMLPGTSFLLIARQLERALRTKMVDLDDRKLVAALQSLSTTLAETLPAT